MMTTLKQLGEAKCTSVTEVPAYNFSWEVDLESPAPELPDNKSWRTTGKKIIPIFFSAILMLIFHKLLQKVLS